MHKSERSCLQLPDFYYGVCVTVKSLLDKMEIDFEAVLTLEEFCTYIHAVFRLFIFPEANYHILLFFFSFINYFTLSD